MLKEESDPDRSDIKSDRTRVTWIRTESSNDIYILNNEGRAGVLMLRQALVEGRAH